eukprot:5425382-Amphidinium_carterae.1
MVEMLLLRRLEDGPSSLTFFGTLLRSLHGSLATLKVAQVGTQRASPLVCLLRFSLIPVEGKGSKRDQIVCAGEVPQQPRGHESGACIPRGPAKRNEQR